MATNPYAVNFITKDDPRYKSQTLQTNGDTGQVNPLDYWLSLAPKGDNYWQQYGFTGPSMTQGTDQNDPVMSPELLQFMKDKGYQVTTDGGHGWNALADAQGNYVPGSEYGNRSNDDAAFIAGALGLGAFGALAGAGGGGLSAAEIAPSASTTSMVGGDMAAGVGGAAGSSSAPVWNAALADSAAGTAGYGASSAGAGGGAAASWGAGAGYAADAANVANTVKPMSNSTSLADFFSGNGSMSDYLRAAQTAYGLYAQNKATDAAAAGNQAQLELMARMYDQNRADNQPLVDMRNSVLPQIQNLLKNPNSITSDPGYQFQLKQGQNALNNRAAASGNYYSGAQMKAAQQYGQDYAGTKLDQSLNRLMGVATGTQVGANNNQQNANQFAVSGGNALAQGGNIRAGGYMGQYNTVNNNINDWMQDQYNQKYWGGGK